MRMSDWTLLRTLYECHNLTKAAELLYMSQPTLTKRLQALEEEFGVTIAIRGKRGIQFTPDGEYLAVKAVQISNIMTEIQTHLAQSSLEPPQTLTIGSPNSMARFSLPSILSSYHKAHPHVQFDIITNLSSQICKLVSQGKADLGFLYGEVPFQGEKLLFATEHIYLASAEPVDMENLGRYPYITYIKDPYSQSILEDWWKEFYFTPFPRGLSVQHGDICKEMILKGLGYSIFFVRGYMADYPEYIYPLCHRDGSPLTRNTWLIYTKESLDKKAVWDFISCCRTDA